MSTPYSRERAHAGQQAVHAYCMYGYGYYGESLVSTSHYVVSPDGEDLLYISYEGVEILPE